jgi:hypothetical protein
MGDWRSWRRNLRRLMGVGKSWRSLRIDYC